MTPGYRLLGLKDSRTDKQDSSEPKTSDPDLQTQDSLAPKTRDSRDHTPDTSRPLSPASQKPTSSDPRFKTPRSSRLLTPCYRLLGLKDSGLEHKTPISLRHRTANSCYKTPWRLRLVTLETTFLRVYDSRRQTLASRLLQI